MAYSPFSYRIKNCYSRGDTIYKGFGPPTSITIEEKANLQPYLMEAIFTWGLLLSDDSSLDQIDLKLVSTVTMIQITMLNHSNQV